MEKAPHNGRTSYYHPRCCFVPKSTLSCQECKVIRHPQLVAVTIYMRELTKIRKPKLGHERAFYIYRLTFEKMPEKNCFLRPYGKSETNGEAIKRFLDCG